MALVGKILKGVDDRKALRFSTADGGEIIVRVIAAPILGLRE